MIVRTDDDGHGTYILNWFPLYFLCEKEEYPLSKGIPKGIPKETMNFSGKRLRKPDYSEAGQLFTPSSRIDSLPQRKRLALAPSG